MTLSNAITVATVILQAVAAHNRGDGGLGATLSAINGKLDIAIGQLASLQKSIEFITTQVAQLDQKLADALAEEFVLELRNKVIAKIELFQDTTRAAKADGVDLLSDTARSGHYWIQLERAYQGFNDARRELWNAPAGNSPTASTICSDCSAIDASAFGYGLFPETELSEVFERHVAWIKRMLDFSVPRSVASSLQDAKAEEAATVKQAKDESEIAYRLYTEVGDVLFCVRSKTPIYFTHADRSYEHAGDSLTVLSATMQRADTVAEGGAAQFSVGMGDQKRSVAYYRPSGELRFESQKTAAAVQDKCPWERRPDLKLDEKQSWDFFSNEQSANNIVWNDALRGNRWTYIKEPKSLAAAQIFFDRINASRIKQQFLRSCLDHASENLFDVETLLQNLPRVP